MKESRTAYIEHNIKSKEEEDKGREVQQVQEGRGGGMGVGGGLTKYNEWKIRILPRL